MTMTGSSTRPSGSDSYPPRPGTVVSWRLAQPIQDLLDQDSALSEFQNLGTVGNLYHLQKHGGHTPWRGGSKRGIIWAKDTHCPPGFLAWLIRKCKSSYDTTWIDFFNCDYKQYDSAGNYLGTSGDGHFHCEVADGHENARTTLFTDFHNEVTLHKAPTSAASAPTSEDDDMTPDQANRLANVESLTAAVYNMLLDGKSPTGNQTVGGGKPRVELYAKLAELQALTEAIQAGDPAALADTLKATLSDDVVNKLVARLQS